DGELPWPRPRREPRPSPEPRRQAGARRKPSRLQRRRAERKRRRAARRERRAARKHLVGRHPFASGALALAVALTPVWVSLGEALTNPGLGVTLPGRLAEWVRMHGGGGFVAWAENFYYSHNPPPVGGRPPKGAIPTAPGAHRYVVGTAARHGLRPLPLPPPITPIASPPLPGEGQWHPVGRRVDGVPAVYEAFLRPDAIHTSLVAGVAWMDTRLLSARLYSGSIIPGGGPYKYTAPVEPGAARTLVAAFNAGFLMSNANGGYYTQGRTIVPLRNGAASVVIYKNGSVTIGAWGTGSLHMESDVASVRQNLSLLVEHGRPVPGLNPYDNIVWGATLGGADDVWRSGLGETADGALVYVAGPGLNITSLANLLVHAGAVTGMELDINTDWVDYATFDPSTPTGLASPANGRNLLSDMAGAPDRYFASWWARDFFTMSAR
ncbi:MAG TPA: phosphodiester glycosidase family protein, partial [Acidimicrobiales bacterium]|nr:phosphodiester glycosidase family protein [Acidimicrobiales bacterium]